MARKPDPKSGEAESKDCTFEASLARLEQIARELEEGDLGLDAALARYQEGVACLRECRRMLEQTERKIELLTGVSESGEAITAPFDDEAQTLAEKAETRGRRRSIAARRASSSEETQAGESPAGELPAGDSPSLRQSTPGSQAFPEAEVDVDSPKRLF